MRVVERASQILKKMIKYKSTRSQEVGRSFKEALFGGLAGDGGLFIPERIPQISTDFFDHISSLSELEIAEQVLWPYVEGSLSREKLKVIVKEAFNFPVPTVPVNGDQFVLELFHGPTKAFKDIGARFMSRCLGVLGDEKKTKVLVATSGDTGSAVANGFLNVPGVEVKVLFPKRKVSPYQEFQMTSLGENIQAIEVDGSFDDCQRLVKQAFCDEELKKRVQLSSANSINIARLLPQMVYYFWMYKNLKRLPGIEEKDIVVSVPSGNLGNLTAGLIAQQMGLPIKRFIAAHNANKTFPEFMDGKPFVERPSIETLANAMDVGAPSNFERIMTLMGDDRDRLKGRLLACSFHDEEILEEIQQCFQRYNYLLDPHGAVGKLALNRGLSVNETGVFLETAHPQKFAEVIKRAIPDYREQEVSLENCRKSSISNNYEELVYHIV